MSGYRDCLEVLIENGAAKREDYKWALSKFTKVDGILFASQA
jgi:hypothetical protein